LTYITSSISEPIEITVKLQEHKELITPVMKLMEIVQDSNSSQDENVCDYTDSEAAANSDSRSNFTILVAEHRDLVLCNKAKMYSLQSKCF